MSIGTTIKRLRRERSITQEQLAEYLGISTGAVSQWECDRTAPDITQLPLLANIFDVSADELLEIGGKKKEEVIRSFLRKYDELSNKGDLTIPYPSFRNRCIADVTERSMSTSSKRICVTLPSIL